MTEPVNQLDANTNTWRDLLETVNEISAIITDKAVTTGGAANGNVQVDGIVKAQELYDNLQRVVTQAREVNTGTGLTGGGPLNANRTIAFDSNTNALLAKANTALQTADFTGKLGLQEKVDVSKIDTVSGTANSSTLLYGDGTWKTIGASVLDKATYDPTNINASPFVRANHTGTQAISTVTGLQANLDSKLSVSGGTTTNKVTFTANTANNAAINILVGPQPSVMSSGDVAFTNTDIVVQLGANTNVVWHSNNLTKPSQAEAEAGTANTGRIWTAERDLQAFMAFMNSQQATLKWMSRGIGEFYVVDDSIAGTDIPPTNDSRFRYIKLTAGLTGSGQYNDGILISESISGSAPLVVATAVINLVGSPINGKTISLLNTEGRFIRPSTSAGTKQDDQMQGHWHDVWNNAAGGTALPMTGLSNAGMLPSSKGATKVGFVAADIVSDGVNGTPRTGTETRVKNIGVTYYMRIK